jgi:hypothetical protein
MNKKLPDDYCYLLVKDFLAKSLPAAKALAHKAQSRMLERDDRKITLFRFVNGKKRVVPVEGDHLFLRGSVEYTNPQLTVEEVQGVIGVRLLATCANYCLKTGVHVPTEDDVVQLCEELKHPSKGYVLPFLLNTDDVEADRYSMNPLKQSLVDSGQSAFPAANVSNSQLKVDEKFVRKYEGSLISRGEADLISSELLRTDSYMDFVDSVKFTQLKGLSEVFGMDLSLYALRMPLSPLKAEDKSGLLHHIVSEAHRDYETIEESYKCMGRSMNKRTTLLTIPHSKKGFGSKRAAHGRLHLGSDEELRDVNVKYKTTKLYPNAMDPQDVAIAECEDDVTVSGDLLSDYSYAETPSSPQFFLYSLGSPEDAALWHGIGAFGSSGLIQSYVCARNLCRGGSLIRGLAEKFGVKLEVPLQFNLAPDGMWSHPIHRNIDASIGSVEDMANLAGRGMWVEYLSNLK